MNIYCQIYNTYMLLVQELHIGIKCNCDVYRYMLKNYQIDRYPVWKYVSTDYMYKFRVYKYAMYMYKGIFFVGVQYLNMQFQNLGMWYVFYLINRYEIQNLFIDIYITCLQNISIIYIYIYRI